MFIASILVLVGLLSLVAGANWLVDGASSLSSRNGISDLVIGLTVVAFGTSAPELVVNITASIHGSTDIVLANVVGSNNFNLYVILGLCGLILPINVQSSTAWREIPISIAMTILLILLLTDFTFLAGKYLSRFDGAVMLMLFLGFLLYVFRQTRQDIEIQGEVKSLSTYQIWGLIVFGFAGLIVGGRLVVDNSLFIADSLNVSEKIIGVTLVAAGTSLPELMTSLVAAIKGKSDLAIGNVIGSNIFNIIFILSVSCMIKPIQYSSEFNLDFILLIGGSFCLFFFMLSGVRKRLDRWESGFLFLIYMSYVSYLIFNR